MAQTGGGMGTGGGGQSGYYIAPALISYYC
jgi:hypothetical protein